MAPTSERLADVQAPARLIEAGMASIALVARVVASKFAWQMPLNRQTQMLAGYGVDLDRSTLVHWVDRTAWWSKGCMCGFQRCRPHVLNVRRPPVLI